MTCHDARLLFSARVDDALTEGERAGLEAHLAGCAECRRELARFEGTVALLHGVPPARAPVGFVDRVLEAARPVPWYARLGRRLAQPLAWRRPLEVTVVVVVGVTAVYLYQRSPDLQQATHQVPSYPVPTQAAPPPPAARAKTEATAPSPRAAAPPAVAPTPAPGKNEARETDAFRHQAAGAPEPKLRDAPERAPALAGRMTEAPPAAVPPAPAPPAATVPPAPAAPAPAERQAAARSDTGARQETAKRAFGPASAAGIAAAGPDVTGRLAVADRAAAETALRELLARLGATEVARRRDGDGLVLEIVLPGAAYAELAAGLARIGRWQPERVPSEIPRELRLSLRLAD